MHWYRSSLFTFLSHAILATKEVPANEGEETEHRETEYAKAIRGGTVAV